MLLGRQVLSRAARSCVISRTMSVAVGSTYPDVELHESFPPTKHSTKTLLAGKKVLVVGLPGAFTPT